MRAFALALLFAAPTSPLLAAGKIHDLNELRRLEEEKRQLAFESRFKDIRPSKSPETRIVDFIVKKVSSIIDDEKEAKKADKKRFPGKGRKVGGSKKGGNKLIERIEAEIAERNAKL